ncbi:ABC transporter B family member [Trifolium medium]|uniref:ABC transporter B family member n=1 Tax=Trifolium medium TaxID=97028 RepID=A0A392QE03_9FABA|nr:ABC transporter B family member [Trifolium medium]
MELPQEYRSHHTLFEIASAIGTPFSLDEATKTRAFGHYARILVDMDLSRHVFYEILVEREGYSFKLAVVYECLPAFCMHCGIIGHSVQACDWLKPSEAKVDNRGNKIITIKKEAANMQYVPKKKENALPSTSTEAIEVGKKLAIQFDRNT